MAIPSPKKEARGRKAAESLEKTFQKSEPAFSEQETKDMRDDMRDDMRKLNTKRSILNLRKKTKEYKEKKSGFVYEDEPRSKEAKELIRKGKVVGYT